MRWLPGMSMVVVAVVLLGLGGSARAVQATEATASTKAVALDAFLDGFERAHAKGDAGALAELVDLDVAVQKAAQKVVLDAAGRERLRALVAERLAFDVELAHASHRTRLSSSERDDDAFARYAFWSDAGAIAIVEYELARTPGGAFRIRDRHDAGLGAWGSVLARFEWAHEHEAPPERVDELVLGTWEEHAAWKACLAALRARTKEALRAAWDAHHAAIDEHPLSTAWLLQAARIDGGWLELACAQQEELELDGPTPLLTAIELALHDGALERGFTALLELELEIGVTETFPDAPAGAAMEALRARLFERGGDHAIAAEAYERALLAEPACGPAWLGAVRERFAARDFARAGALLLELPDSAPAHLDRALALPGAKEFEASPSHAAWKDAARRLSSAKERVTWKAAVDFGVRWIAVQASEDIGLARKEFDVETLLARSLQGGPAKFRSEFAAGVRSGFEPKLLIATQFGEGFALRLLRVSYDVGRRIALFSARSSDGGVGYLEYVLERGADGAARAVDFRSYSSGEWASETIRRSYLPLAVEKEKGLLEKLRGKESAFVKHAKELREMGAAMEKGEHARVLAVFARLPTELKRERVFLVLRMHAAHAAGEAEYIEALEDMIDALGGDPCLDLTLIDYHLLNKEFAQALDSVARLEGAIGGDPGLDVVRSSVHLLAGQPVLACADARRALRRLPSDPDAWWTWVGALLKLREHATLFEALVSMDARFAIEWNDFVTVPEYAEFAKSPEHELWKLYLKTKDGLPRHDRGAGAR